MRDIEYFIDNKSFDELKDMLDTSLLHQSSFGFHIGSDSGKWFDFLEGQLQPGDLFPIQIMSGPALTLRYFSAIPDSLVRMVQLDKVKLCVHLPFVVTMYKEFKSLGYQRDAFKELSSYYHNAGILEKVYFLFHCSHPEFTTDGNLYVQWSYWKRVALENIQSFLCYFPHLLIENLAGYRAQPMDVSSPNAIWNDLLKGSDLENKVGIALDTEHLFASGNTLAELDPEVIKRVQFVHCNAAPSSVIFGKFVDLHSYTSIASSLERNIGPFKQEGSTVDDYFRLGLHNIPAVFERKYMSLQIDDLKTMLSSSTFSKE